MSTLIKNLSQLVLMICLVLLASCGHKGDLYIPEPDTGANDIEVTGGDSNQDDNGEHAPGKKRGPPTDQ
ncbi:MAG: hypothetical protein CSA52_02875 [Gammaproteobacteria bacterium]|nr:MAG: hypothetical protein CSB48_04545 [Pseudomonadota bacterium]PIE38342.1 MAG: hypothetical protein CSA52_02875 [Gammaproteobacteria bacterium]